MTHPLIETTEQEMAKLNGPLRALWHVQRGDWKTAHEIVQDDSSADAAWVHAYLHRVEGDLGNARYWYHHAGKKPAMDLTLEEEWDDLATALSR